MNCHGYVLNKMGKRVGHEKQGEGRSSRNKEGGDGSKMKGQREIRRRRKRQKEQPMSELLSEAGTKENLGSITESMTMTDRESIFFHFAPDQHTPALNLAAHEEIMRNRQACTRRPRDRLPVQTLHLSATYSVHVLSLKFNPGSVDEKTEQSKTPPHIGTGARLSRLSTVGYG